MKNADLFAIAQNWNNEICPSCSEERSPQGNFNNQGIFSLHKILLKWLRLLKNIY